jgi:hypothetical protein
VKERATRRALSLRVMPTFAEIERVEPKRDESWGQRKGGSVMKRMSLWMAMVMCPVAVFGDQTQVKVQGEAWSITFDSPSLSEKQESSPGGNYVFQANADRFNISIFVEKPQAIGNSNKDCYKFYWPRTSRNPMIANDTVVMTETSKYVRVQYDIVTKFQGKPIRARNVNYYFAFRGKWIDVHISIMDPKKEDDAVFVAFDKSLTYGS